MQDVDHALARLRDISGLNALESQTSNDLGRCNVTVRGDGDTYRMNPTTSSMNGSAAAYRA